MKHSLFILILITFSIVHGNNYYWSGYEWLYSSGSRIAECGVVDGYTPVQYGTLCHSACGTYCPSGWTELSWASCQGFWHNRVCEPPSAAKAVIGVNDEYGYEVYARANFDDYGEAKIDENGNIIISLDFSDDHNIYDICQFDDDKSVSFLYYIYEKWNNDKLDLLYNEECNDVVGGHFNPFSKPLCNEIDDEPNYYNCEMGDLSGRFKAAYLNSDNKIIIEENLSYSKGKDGFCASKLAPESLFEKSIAFHCNNDDQRMVFCAPFSIFVVEDKN
eukprot:343817_1